MDNSNLEFQMYREKPILYQHVQIECVQRAYRSADEMEEGEREDSKRAHNTMCSINKSANRSRGRGRLEHREMAERAE